MISRSSAVRYARALLDVALQESIADQAERDLASFADLLARHEDLRTAATHPAVPAARKRSLVGALASRLQLSVPVTKLLVLLADRDRLALVPELLERYRERLLEHRNVVRAEVTTAETLTADREAAIGERLTRATGRQVMLTTRVDPSIIGGAVARIGSVVYDGSLAAQLTRMRERLARDY
jgi:F-type H+-transporting ATPase subunit delta